MIIFGLVFKLLISVVSKGLIYFLLWKYKAELIQFILGSKARMVASDIGNKVEKGVTKTREVASQVPSRSLSSAQHLGNLALAGAGFGAGMVMNAKNHFQNVGSFFTNKESEHQPDEVLPTETLETPTSPDAPESSIPKTKPTLEGIKPVEEKIPTPSMESPITVGPTPSSNEEFQTLKEEWTSPFKQLRINGIEHKLEEYKDPQAMYKAQGSNAFTRAYRKTMTQDDKLRANIERRDRLTERLKQLRGE